MRTIENDSINNSGRDTSPRVDLESLGRLLNGDTLREIQGELATIANIAEISAEMRSGDLDTVVKALRAILSDENVGATFESNLTILAARSDPAHYAMPLLRACVEANVPAYLHGEAGSGKTSAAHRVAEEYGLPFRSVSLSPSLMDSRLLGYMDATGTYRESAFREIYEGGGVFLFDEIDNCNPSSLAVVNNALANSSAEFADARADKHPNTRIIAAANTIGKGATSLYVGRAAIDAATLDRFSFIGWDIDENLERSLILGDGTKHNGRQLNLSEGGIPTRSEWLDRVQAFRSRLRSSQIRHVISPRASIYGAALLEQGVGVTHLDEMLVYKGLGEHDRQALQDRNNGW